MRLGVTALLLLCCGCVAASAHAMQTKPPTLSAGSPIDSVADAYRRSTFVFTGQVSRVAATTTPSVLPRDAIVVSVRALQDTVYLLPRGMRPLQDRMITVVVGDSKDWVVGATELFYAYGVAADVGLAVRAVAHVPTGAMPRSEITRVLRSAREFLIADTLRLMFERSALVIIGTVDSVAMIAQAERGGPNRRAWKDATIRIQTTLKTYSHERQSRIHVLFPAYPDRPGMRIPQLMAGRQYLIGLSSPGSVRDPDLAEIVNSGSWLVLNATNVRSVADTIRLAGLKR